MEPILLEIDSSLATDRLKRAVAAAVDAHPFIVCYAVKDLPLHVILRGRQLFMCPFRFWKRPLIHFLILIYGRQLPALVPGELLISGAGVSAGYLNRDDLTEKAFIANPYTKEPGYERAYRSGDVVRLLANGDVDFIGRNDGQVKVRAASLCG